MAKRKVFTSKFIAGVGILTAIEVVLYIVGTLILNPAGFNINLSLIPIALGAIFYGPICGLFLGVVNGVAVILTPATQSFFMNTNLFGDWCVFGTILVCLLKTSLAGFASGFVYNIFKNKKEIIGIILASLIIPVLNTGIFALGVVIFFNSQLKTILTAALAFNFTIEFLLMGFLCPAIIKIVTIKKSKDVGVSNEENK